MIVVWGSSAVVRAGAACILMLKLVPRGMVVPNEQILMHSSDAMWTFFPI